MADTFFEFNSGLPGGLDENLRDDALGHSVDDEEEEYDALNDETFGAEDVDDDWEQDHEKLAEFTEQSRPQRDNLNNCVVENGDGLDLEQSLSRLVLEEYDESEARRPRERQSHSKLGDYTSTSPGHSVWGVSKNDGLPHVSTPILSRTPLPNIKNVCTVEELERGLLTQRSPGPGLGMPSPNLPNRPMPPVASPAGNFRQMLDHHAKRRARMDGEQICGMSAPPELETHMMNMQNHRHMGPLMMPKLPAGFRPLMNRMDSNVVPPNIPGGYAVRGFHRKPPHSGRPMQMDEQPVGIPLVLGNNPQFSPNGLRPFFNHPMMPPPMCRPNDVLSQFGGPRVPPHLAPHHPHLAPLSPQRGGMPVGGGMNHYPYHKGHNDGNYRYHQQQNHHRNAVNGAGDHDEYAGLMTNWQKQWLLNIQNLQLNVGPAYIADYYYTVYKHRKEKLEESKKAAPSSLDRHPFDRRERSDSLKSSNWGERPSSNLGPTKTYTPLQFENSLGKLQCGSVTAPRKLIDMEGMSPEVNDGTQPTQRDTKKTKQLLLEIESMYLLLLKLEDALNPMAQTAAAELAANKILKRALAAAARDEERKHDSDAGEEDDEPEEDRIEEQPNPEELVQRLSSMLLHQSDKLLSVLSIRKGKTLLLRLLPHIPPDAPLVSSLFGQLMCGLPALARRDAGPGPLLPRFVPFFRRWVSACGLAQLLRLTTALVNDSRLTGVPNRRALTVALGNKFGSSALSVIMSTVAEHLPSMSEEDTGLWKDFMEALLAVTEVARIPDNASSRPVDPLEVSVLQTLLSETRVKTTEQQTALLKQALCTRDDTRDDCLLKMRTALVLLNAKVDDYDLK